MNLDITDEMIDNSVILELNNVSKLEDKIHFSQDTLELAFQLISDASVGRITHFERTTDCLRYYKLYLNGLFRLIRAIFHITLVVLLIVDTTNKDSRSTPAKISITLECLCLIFYSVQLFVVFKFSKRDKFLRDIKHYLTAITILISIMDISLFACRVYQFRISPAFRIFLFINSAEQSQIRRHLRTLRMTIVNVLMVVPFLLTFYFMMVAFIYRYFKSDELKKTLYYNGRPYMENFFEIVWETLVFVTSANSPDVMLPACSKSYLLGVLFLLFYAVFFFLLIFVYGLIMGHFRDHAKLEMKNLVTEKLSLIYEAFLLLTEKIEIKDSLDLNNSIVLRDVISKEKWNLLIERFKKYKNNKEASDILFSLLSKFQKNYLTKNEFMQLADLLSIPLNVVSSSLNIFEKYMWFGFSNKLSDFVETKYFGMLVACVIVINSICITFTNLRFIELFFCFLFLIEIFLRVYVKGFQRYFHSIWNIFDFIIILLAFLFWFIEYTEWNVQTISFTLLVFRNLRLLKLLRGITAYHQLLHILGMLIPTISSLTIIVFCFTSIYTCIGVWCYHGYFMANRTEVDYITNSSNCFMNELNNSEFGRLHYCILSFNTFISGFVTLSAVSIGNNWQIISEGYELGSGHTVLSRLYFSLYKGVVTYLLLLIIAFVLDVFLLAYNQKSTLNIEESVHQKLNELKINFISYKHLREMRTVSNSSFPSLTKCFSRVRLCENNHIWFRLKAKGARSVEYISQAMFQDEIEKELKLNIKYMHFFESE